MKNITSFYMILFLANVVFGGYTDDYQHAAFNVLYSGGLFPNLGETKMLDVEFNTVSILAGNTYDAELDITEVSRSITNRLLTGADEMVGNGFSVDVEFNYASINGLVQPLPYNVLLATPVDENSGFPFAFNTTTNVALAALVNDTRESGFETGLSILVRHSSGKDDSSINGRYARFTMESACENRGQIDLMQLAATTIEFDGTGNYTESGTESVAERWVKETVADLGDDDFINETVFTLTNGTDTAFTASGTYAVHDTGRINLAQTQGALIDFQISSDDNLAISTSGFLSFQPGGESGMGMVTGGGARLSVLIKVSDDHPTVPMDEVYYLGELSEQIRTGSAGFSTAGISASRMYLHLQPNWTFSIRSDEWLVENRFQNQRLNTGGSEPNIESVTLVETEAFDKSIWLAQGTYTIQTNGVLSLSFSNGESAQAQLSANNEYLAYAAFNNGNDEVGTQLGIGIRRVSPVPAAPVIIDSPEYTSTGAVLTLSIPTNLVVEALASTNLTFGIWESGGLISSTSGTLEITDPAATNTASRFYTTSFAPW